MTETWTDNSSEVAVSNFEAFILNRVEKKQKSKRNSGRVILYLRNSFVNANTLVYTSKDDILWIKIDKSKLALENDLYICLCYVTPDESSRQSLNETIIFDRLLDSVVLIESKSQFPSNLIICGDFNSRTSTNADFVEEDQTAHMSVLPDDYMPDRYMSRYSQDKGHVNNNGLLLLDFCKQTGVRIMNGRVGSDRGVGKYTFVGSRGSSVVDYVLSSQELFNLIEGFDVQEPNIMSDHCLVNFSFNFDIQCSDDARPECDKKVTGKYAWKPEFKAHFVNSLQLDSTRDKLNILDSKISESSSDEDVTTCLSDFSNIINEIAEPIFKLIKPKNWEHEEFSNSNANPRYSDECRGKKFMFLHTLNAYRESQTDETRIAMVKARSEYKSLIRKCRYNYDKEKTSRFITAKHKNARMYWNMLKEAAGMRPANISLSAFEQYFKAVNNVNDPFYAPDEDVMFFIERYEKNEFDIMFDELNLDFSTEEIGKSINQLKTNKSAGPDYLINEFFIHGKQVLVPVLRNLFNMLFERGYFPEEWSEGYIIPLHKKGSIHDVENYRGITLLSTLGKLFTRVLNNRLSEWAESYYVLIEAQAGFRAHMGTVDNIFVLHGLISHLLNQGKKLYCAFVDFTKAFDYVVRDNLWYKLIKLGLRGKIINIIKSMYSSVKSRVKLNNNFG